MRIKTFLTVIILAVATARAGAEQSFTFLFFNDFHAHVEPFALKDVPGTVGGVARLATLVEDIRRENAAAGVPTFLLVAGDVLQGTPYSTVYRGAVEFACLNEMGVDAMCLGNHEFDYGRDNLRTLMASARFPIIAANITVSDGPGEEPFAPAATVLKAGDVRVVVIGLTTPDTPVATAPANVAGLTFGPTAAAAKNVIGQYRDDADVFVALTHQGFAEDRKMAEGVPELALIVGGHSHTKVDKWAVVGDTVICQAYEYGEYLGRIDLVAKEGGRVDVTRYELIAVNDGVPASEAVTAVVASHKTTLDSSMSEVVGKADAALLYKVGREGETNFGDVVADCMLSATGADCALFNAGGIRADIFAGDVTLGQVLTALPFGNEVWVLELIGQRLKDTLDLCAREKVGTGGFLQVGGLEYAVRPGVGADEIRVGGEALDVGATYAVAVPDFLAAGGDGYAMLKSDEPPLKTGLLINDLVISALRDARPIPPGPAGRIRILTE